MPLKYYDKYNLGQFSTGSFFFDAIKAGDVEAIKSMLENKEASVNERLHGNGYLPLTIAAINNQLEIGKVLLDYGADIDAKEQSNRTVLSYAFGKEFSQMLVNRGANLYLRNDFGKTAQKTLKKDFPEVAKALKDASRQQRKEMGTLRWLMKNIRP